MGVHYITDSRDSSKARRLSTALNVWPHDILFMFIIIIIVTIIQNLFIALEYGVTLSGFFFFQKKGKKKDKKVQITKWHAIPTYHMFLSVFQFRLNSIIIRALCVYVNFIRTTLLWKVGSENVQAHACSAIVMLI